MVIKLTQISSRTDSVRETYMNEKNAKQVIDLLAKHADNADVGRLPYMEGFFIGGCLI